MQLGIVSGTRDTCFGTTILLCCFFAGEPLSTTFLLQKHTRHTRFFFQHILSVGSPATIRFYCIRASITHLPGFIRRTRTHADTRNRFVEQRIKEVEQQEAAARAAALAAEATPTSLALPPRRYTVGVISPRLGSPTYLASKGFGNFTGAGKVGFPPSEFSSFCPKRGRVRLHVSRCL